MTGKEIRMQVKLKSIITNDVIDKPEVAKLNFINAKSKAIGLKTTLEVGTDELGEVMANLNLHEKGDVCEIAFIQDQRTMHDFEDDTDIDEDENDGQTTLESQDESEEEDSGESASESFIDEDIGDEQVAEEVEE